jgi:hypothetical protein
MLWYLLGIMEVIPLPLGPNQGDTTSRTLSRFKAFSKISPQGLTCLDDPCCLPGPWQAAHLARMTHERNRRLCAAWSADIVAVPISHLAVKLVRMPIRMGNEY